MKRREKSLTKQIVSHSKKKVKEKAELDGSTDIMISTGSTLLDLAISGGRVYGGGIPMGIFVEVFGPSSAGKTVLLCEIAGQIQKLKGDILFRDPEGRLNKQFARMFDFDVKTIDYDNQLDTIPELFEAVREWKNENEVKAVFADSLAALSTNLEMENKEGDKMGGRRGKEFSEQMRRTCRILTNKNILMVGSNQIRDVMDAKPFQEKQKSPGGFAIGFYSSLRLKFGNPRKIKKEKTYKGKKIEKTIGVQSMVEVYKSSVWQPYHNAPLYILFDYGIDDIRSNLQYIKDYSDSSVYTLNGENLDKSLDKAISIIEEENCEQELKKEVIELWQEIESKFESNRIKKRR